MSSCICAENRATEKENISVLVETRHRAPPCIELGGKQMVAKELVLDEMKEGQGRDWGEA